MEYVGKKVYVRVTTVEFDQEGMIKWLQDRNIKSLDDLAIFESNTTTHEAGEVVAVKEDTDSYSNKYKLAVKFENGQIVDYDLNNVYFAEPPAKAVEEPAE
jgi:hypothetical protein